MLQMDIPKLDPEAAESLIKGSFDLARSLNALPIVAQGQLALADVWAKAGKPARAIEAIDSALQVFGAIRHLPIPNHLLQLRNECTQSLSDCRHEEVSRA